MSAELSDFLTASRVGKIEKVFSSRLQKEVSIKVLGAGDLNDLLKGWRDDTKKGKAPSAFDVEFAVIQKCVVRPDGSPVFKSIEDVKQVDESILGELIVEIVKINPYGAGSLEEVGKKLLASVDSSSDAPAN